MSIEAMKQALEASEKALKAIRESIQYFGSDGHLRDALDELDCIVIPTFREAIADAEDNYQGSDAAKAAHMMDLYTALGVKWGENPFAVITKMRCQQPKEK